MDESQKELDGKALKYKSQNVVLADLQTGKTKGDFDACSLVT
jgi:hypothetical protein